MEELLLPEQKKCFKCGITKPLTEFYKHERASGGRLNKCKVCTCLDVSANRKAKIDYYREYDKKRATRPDRVAARAEYAKKNPEVKTKTNRRYRARNPEKYKAVAAFGKAVGRGQVSKLPCFVCGKINVQGHHHDYSKPLEVTWLCARHHAMIHGKCGGFPFIGNIEDLVSAELEVA